jgi:hypothetical protein
LGITKREGVGWGNLPIVSAFTKQEGIVKPIRFKEQNVVYAKNQQPYLPLPSYQDDEQGGRIFHCWKLTIRERIKILFTGKLWINVLNFHLPPQPIKPMVDSPFIKINRREE